LSIVIFCAIALAACGLKGPLYMPDDNATSESVKKQNNDTGEKDAEDETRADTGN